MNRVLDENHMQQAIDLAESVRWHTPPNPWVGCVIVREGEVVGQGATAPPGGRHAEIKALQHAGIRSAGATLYSTLEPCCHTNKRTPPCTNAIIEAKIKKVVIGLEDPDPNVSGLGIKQLREAGIEVVVDVLQEKIAQSLLPYIHHRRTGLPYVVGKWAQSLDGKIAAQDGTSQWISSEEARQDVQCLRANSQAILIGANTATFDKPRLNVRIADLKPLRIVIDPKARVPKEGPLFDPALGPLLVATAENFPNLHVDLKPLLSYLGKQGILQLLVEGGGTTLSHFIKQKCLNALTIYQGSMLLGDKGKPAIPDLDIHTLDHAERFQLKQHAVLGNTIRLDYAQH